MKDVIDVMQLQRDKSRQVPAIDYTETENGFIAMRYIFECGKDISCFKLEWEGWNIYLTWLISEMHIKFGCMCYKNICYFLSSTRQLHLFTEITSSTAEYGMEAMFKITHAKKWLLVSEFMAHIQQQKPSLNYIMNKDGEREFYLLLRLCNFNDGWIKTLKLTTPFISSPVTDICNKLLSSGIFPTRLKFSGIKLSFKNGDRTIISNFRPISLLISFPKVFEKFTYWRLLSNSKPKFYITKWTV